MFQYRFKCPFEYLNTLEYHVIFKYLMIYQALIKQCVLYYMFFVFGSTLIGLLGLIGFVGEA